METKDDGDVIRVATAALIRRMSDDQINRVVRELEYVAEERGDRADENAHAQAAPAAALDLGERDFSARIATIAFLPGRTATRQFQWRRLGRADHAVRR
jgi:hypothetical protein